MGHSYRDCRRGQEQGRILAQSLFDGCHQAQRQWSNQKDLLRSDKPDQAHQEADRREDLQNYPVQRHHYHRQPTDQLRSQQDPERFQQDLPPEELYREEGEGPAEAEDRRDQTAGAVHSPRKASSPLKERRNSLNHLLTQELILDLHFLVQQSLSRALKQRSTSKSLLQPWLSASGQTLRHPELLFSSSSLSAIIACYSFVYYLLLKSSLGAILFLQSLLSLFKQLLSVENLWSIATIPIIVKRSATIVPLILRSISESVFRDGLRFTSRSQGFKLESKSTSKPSNQKQLFLKGTDDQAAAKTGFSIEITVFMTRSSILLMMSQVSKPQSFRRASKACRDHLDPSPSSGESMNLSLCLFKEQLVRWTKGFSRWSLEYLQVAKRASPSLQMQILRGLKQVMDTQIRRSNFSPSTSKGFSMYSDTTTVSFTRFSIYQTLSLTQIPFPWELLWGFIIHSPLLLSPSSEKRLRSLGRTQVLGTKLQTPLYFEVALVRL